jgi:hypothetical protein
MSVVGLTYATVTCRTYNRQDAGTNYRHRRKLLSLHIEVSLMPKRKESCTINIEILATEVIRLFYFTDSTQPSPFWEACSSSIGQKFSPIYMKPERSLLSPRERHWSLPVPDKSSSYPHYLKFTSIFSFQLSLDLPSCVRSWAVEYKHFHGCLMVNSELLIGRWRNIRGLVCPLSKQPGTAEDLPHKAMLRNSDAMLLARRPVDFLISSIYTFCFLLIMDYNINCYCIN